MNLQKQWKIKIALFFIFFFPCINLYAAPIGYVTVKANIVSIKCVISYPNNLYFGNYISTNFNDTDAADIKKITISLDCNNVENIVTPTLILQGNVFSQDNSIFTVSSTPEKLNVGFMFKKGEYNTNLNFKDKNNVIYQGDEVTFEKLKNGINLYNLTVGLVKGPINNKVGIGNINVPIKFTILYK
ncbi:TPA: fimbrial protein [Proteus mirabilis]|uniref:fimbrial protein n=1 Tax=Proteus mirabilis TaxID=584 RepID=UPI000F85FCB7|nr:fimbrial protein [Proteus mirabilis]MBG2815084.1 fimbrial protein [Proteus mirabilis]MBG2865194.1 fimbrial protein [Proteus mirabilis]MBL1398400.1 fimbrial protein [Proteus mirabilis]MCL8566576.1 fimbrial protein [Proteus mirabilis]MCL8627576.1 fimbrial protein [Proteus mirabilis]